MTTLEIIVLTVLAIETPMIVALVYFVLFHEAETRKYIAFLQEMLRNGQGPGTSGAPLGTQRTQGSPQEGRGNLG